MVLRLLPGLNFAQTLELLVLLNVEASATDPILHLVIISGGSIFFILHLDNLIPARGTGFFADHVVHQDGSEL